MRAALVIAARIIADSQGFEPTMSYSAGLTFIILFLWEWIF
jgi:hypothetical protein